MAEPNNTPRPVSPSQEAEETTPLLATERGESSSQPQGAEQTETAPLPSSNVENVDPALSGSAFKLFKYIKRTTYVSIISSLVALIFLLAAFATTMLSPYDWYIYRWVDVIFDLGCTILLSLILTILNLSAIRHPYPPQSSSSSASQREALNLQPRTTFFYLPLTLCIDLIFALFIFGLAGRLSSDTPFPYYCHGQQDPGQGDRVGDCERWNLALQILCYLGIAMATVVGLCHLVLFILRSMTVLRYGLWSQPSVWIIPTTGISAQLTIKILGSDSVNAVEA